MVSKKQMSRLAKETAPDEVDGVITEKDFKELIKVLPKPIQNKFMKAKTPAARADFLYTYRKNELKKVRDAYQAADALAKKLDQWFIQEFANSDQTGVSGKLGRVEIKKKDVATVTNWDEFYTHVKRTNSFDLLNRSLNQKAVNARWEDGKQVKGVGVFTATTVSLTAVKGVK